MKKQFSLVECIIWPGIWHIQWTIGHIQLTANCTTSDDVPFSPFSVTLFLATWEKRNGKWFDSYRYQKPSQKKSSTLLMFVIIVLSKSNVPPSRIKRLQEDPDYSQPAFSSSFLLTQTTIRSQALSTKLNSNAIS